MKKITKTASINLAKTFGLEDYENYKIENGSIYIIQEDNFGRKFWLFFGKKIGYSSASEMYNDIAKSLSKEFLKFN